MFLDRVSPAKVSIFSRAEVMSYLMTEIVFKSLWVLAQNLTSVPLPPHKQIPTTSENLDFQR